MRRVSVKRRNTKRSIKQSCSQPPAARAGTQSPQSWGHVDQVMQRDFIALGNEQSFIFYMNFKHVFLIMENFKVPPNKKEESNEPPCTYHPASTTTNSPGESSTLKEKQEQKQKPSILFTLNVHSCMTLKQGHCGRPFHTTTFSLLL